LKDHPNFAATGGPHLSFILFQKVFAVEDNLSTDDAPRGVRYEAHDGECADAFTASAFSYQGHEFAFLNVVANTVHGMDFPFIREEGCPKISDLNQRSHGSLPPSLVRD
jgi:hypothetical protein